MARKEMAQNTKLQKILIHRKCIYVSTMITSQINYYLRAGTAAARLTHFY